MPHRGSKRFNTVTIGSEGEEYIKLYTGFAVCQPNYNTNRLGQSGLRVGNGLVILYLVWFRVDDTRGAKAYL